MIQLPVTGELFYCPLVPFYLSDMFQHDFANGVIAIVREDPDVIGLAAAGSWISKEIDEYSDLDLVLVTQRKIGGDKQEMIAYAKRLGNFISGFTGEHVGEPRVLICLFDDPLIHVDIKFLTLPEFEHRVEDPAILFERDEQLSRMIAATTSSWPMPDYQWIEDRIWTWVHYIATKMARGEYFECIDALNMIRAWVIAPLLQVSNGKQPRGLRKAETLMSASQLEDLRSTLPLHDRHAITGALENTIRIYRSLRTELYGNEILLQQSAEEKAVDYFNRVK